MSGVGVLGDGVLVRFAGAAEPCRSELGGDGGGDVAALALGQGQVDVGGDLCADLVGLPQARNYVDGRDVARGEYGVDGLPVGGVPGLAGFGVGAEDLLRVVACDLVLVTVGGDGADVPQPLLVPSARWRHGAEQAHPGGPVAFGVGCQSANPGADQRGGIVKVAGQAVTCMRR